MGERGTYVPNGGGSGASLKERLRLARHGGNAETPIERRQRLRAITNVADRSDLSRIRLDAGGPKNSQVERSDKAIPGCPTHPYGPDKDCPKCMQGEEG